MPLALKLRLRLSTDCKPRTLSILHYLIFTITLERCYYLQCLLRVMGLKEQRDWSRVTWSVSAQGWTQTQVLPGSKPVFAPPTWSLQLQLIHLCFLDAWNRAWHRAVSCWMTQPARWALPSQNNRQRQAISEQCQDVRTTRVLRKRQPPRQHQNTQGSGDPIPGSCCGMSLGFSSSSGPLLNPWFLPLRPGSFTLFFQALGSSNGMTLHWIN